MCIRDRCETAARHVWLSPVSSFGERFSSSRSRKPTVKGARHPLWAAVELSLIHISAAVINESGELVISYSDGTTSNLGKVVGSDGINGVNGTNCKDGISVSSAEINSEGELVLSVSNGQRANVGAVVGAKGDKGDKGEQGLQGTQGEKGEKGDVYKRQAFGGLLLFTGCSLAVAVCWVAVTLETGLSLCKVGFFGRMALAAV